MAAKNNLCLEFNAPVNFELEGNTKFVQLRQYQPQQAKRYASELLKEKASASVH